MGSEITALSKLLSSVWVTSFVGFLPCMSPVMRPEVEIQREPLFSDVSLEGLLSGVD